MERCLVLAARRYSFKDDANRLVEGVTLSYLTGEGENAADRRGMEPLTISGESRLYSELQDVPGIYEMDFKQRPGKNGRPQLQVAAVRFLKGVNVAAALVQ